MSSAIGALSNTEADVCSALPVWCAAACAVVLRRSRFISLSAGWHAVAPRKTTDGCGGSCKPQRTLLAPDRAMWYPICKKDTCQVKMPSETKANGCKEDVYDVRQRQNRRAARRAAKKPRIFSGAAVRTAERRPQAVSKWETGQSIPDLETLVALSWIYRVSINTLLGNDMPVEARRGDRTEIITFCQPK